MCVSLSLWCVYEFKHVYDCINGGGKDSKRAKVGC